METIGNAMLLISTATLLLPFVCLFFAIFNPESKKQDTQKLNIEVEASKNTRFKNIKHWNEAGQIAKYSDELTQFADIGKMYSEIKAEIIKDFADALKSKSELVAPSVYAVPYRAVSVDDIDNLVKEMTGGENNAD